MSSLTRCGALKQVGGFRLTYDDESVTSFAQARLQFPLVYLVLHIAVRVSRYQLALTKGRFNHE